jgi:hypothetical protein
VNLYQTARRHTIIYFSSHKLGPLNSVGQQEQKKEQKKKKNEMKELKQWEWEPEKVGEGNSREKIIEFPLSVFLGYLF